MNNSSPAVSKVISYITDLIGRRVLGAGSPLPPANALAGTLSVCRVSVLRAFSILKEQGTIEGYRGRRYRVVEAGTGHSAESHPPPKWESIFSAMHQDIVQGLYSDDRSLPSYKALQAAYHVSYPTLRKALHHLAVQKLIRPTSRGFKVITHASLLRDRVVTAIIPPPAEQTKEMSGVFNEELFRYLELACSQSGCRLLLVQCRIDDAKAQPVFEEYGSGQPWHTGREDTVGSILVVPHREFAQQQGVIRMLRQSSTPLVILDQVGEMKLPREVFRDPYVQVYSIGLSDQAPTDVARFLIALGHRHIAYFSRFHRAPWSRTRLQALTETFSTLGEDCRVVPYALEVLPPGSRRDDRRMMGLFDRALGDPSVTAWVMANDVSGRGIIDFLVNSGKRVPDDLSVISFDDSVVALRQRVTSYNFNLSALARAMLNFLFNRRCIPESWRGRTMEIEGTIVVRDSTGRPRRH